MTVTHTYTRQVVSVSATETSQGEFSSTYLTTSQSPTYSESPPITAESGKATVASSVVPEDRSVVRIRVEGIRQQTVESEIAEK